MLKGCFIVHDSRAGFHFPCEKLKGAMYDFEKAMANCRLMDERNPSDAHECELYSATLDQQSGELEVQYLLACGDGDTFENFMTA